MSVSREDYRYGEQMIHGDREVSQVGILPSWYADDKL
jgi:hypothetical protein